MPFCDQVPSPPIPQTGLLTWLASLMHQTSLSLQSGVKTPAGLTPEAFGFICGSPLAQIPLFLAELRFVGAKKLTSLSQNKELHTKSTKHE